MNRREVFKLLSTASLFNLSMLNENCSASLVKESKWLGVESFTDGMWVSYESSGRQVNAAAGEASVADVYKAFEIIWNQPKSNSPYEIARYYNNLSEKNSFGESFTTEWEKSFNPLIVCFFVLAKYQPDGDITPWCAAFINFCIASAGLNPTYSAGSSSFRDYAMNTNKPSPGDLVVFQSRVPSEEWRGHVGFYVTQGKNSVMVLGGNQSDGIRVQNYPKKGELLKFHSYRKLVV